jgi:hypothetical protein
MTPAAPRLHQQLIELLEALAQGQASVAEVRRALVVRARELDTPPPSYEHVRRLVSLTRLELEAIPKSDVLPVLIDVALGLEHGSELVRVARGERRSRRSV